MKPLAAGGFAEALQSKVGQTTSCCRGMSIYTRDGIRRHPWNEWLQFLSPGKGRVVIIAAAYFPARAATKVDPASAMRTD